MSYTTFLVSKYHHSLGKRLFDIVFSASILLAISPLFILLMMLIFLISGRPIFFIQERIGKDGKKFKIIKFRTMVRSAQQQRNKFMKLNQADGPVFKIFEDPRFTNIGKFLSKLGLDELPQFINVIKGDMSIVGPRPLPTYEARKLSNRQKRRELIKPGITSPWVVEGLHALSFNQWMDLDIKYIKKATLLDDIKIIANTAFMLFK